MDGPRDLVEMQEKDIARLEGIRIKQTDRIAALERDLQTREMAEAEAMALVLSHEGHIEKLERELQEKDNLIARFKASPMIDVGSDPDGVAPEVITAYVERVTRERDEARREFNDLAVESRMLVEGARSIPPVVNGQSVPFYMDLAACARRTSDALASAAQRPAVETEEL